MHACTGMHGPAYMHTATADAAWMNRRYMHAAAASFKLLLLRACVRARLRMPVWSTPCISWVFYSSAQTQQAWRIEFSYRNIDVFWKSSRHLSIGRALDAASRATRGFPEHSDICRRNHVWTKCTFGSVLYLLPVLIDGFGTWKIFHVQVTRMAAAAVMVLNLVLNLDLQL
jgi:hypothetical protein